MLIKVIMSAATAICIFLWLWALDVKFAVSLAVAAFLLNFIPVIGNILMALPAVLVALVENHISLALMVVLGYAVVNIVIGNVIEPRLTGRELGLSSVLVLLSLLFWGWVLGPVGLFLSVPLTMAFKTALAILRTNRPPNTDVGSAVPPSA
jgi:predicted PurR-regulated permease PerM